MAVVMAVQRASQPGEEAWAGIGWAQDELTVLGAALLFFDRVPVGTPATVF